VHRNKATPSGSVGGSAGMYAAGTNAQTPKSNDGGVLATKRRRPMAPAIDLTRIKFANKAVLFCRWLGDGVEPPPDRTHAAAGSFKGSPSRTASGTAAALQLLLDGPAGLKGPAQLQKLVTTSSLLYPLVNPNDKAKCGLEFWAGHTKKLRSLVAGLHGRGRVPVYVIHTGWGEGVNPTVFSKGLDLDRIHGMVLSPP
jgi:hypothetical protein